MGEIRKDNLHESLIEELNKLGNIDLSGKQDKTDESLLTESKDVIGAINELFQSANNGKELIANAIGEPLDASDTFSAMSTDINSLLSTFKTNMMNNGITVESSDKFKSLIDKIATMVEEGEGKGMKVVSGNFTYTKTADSPTIMYNKTSNKSCFYHTLELGFKPTLCVMHSNNQSGFEITSLYYDGRFESTYSSGTAGFIYANTGTYCGLTVNNNNITMPIVDALDNYSYNFDWIAIGVGEEDTTLRDSLASILQEEGVSVTEEDDMASLINKVDEEFDRQVVPAGDAVASDVLSGKTFINSTGQLVTGTMANRGGAQTVTPGTSNKTLNSGYYSGNITVQGDSNLKASNIVSGKTIFGVNGTAATISGDFTKTSNAGGSSQTFTPDTWKTFTMSHSLGKIPPLVLVVTYFNNYSLDNAINSIKNYNEATSATIKYGTNTFQMYVTTTNKNIILHVKYAGSSSTGTTTTFYAYSYMFS